MEFTDTAFLRSLRNEAERQAQFYGPRDRDLSANWAELASLAHHCMHEGSMLITIREKDTNPIPIKGGE